MNWKTNSDSPLDSKDIKGLKQQIVGREAASPKAKKQLSAAKEAAAILLDAVGGHGEVILSGYAAGDSERGAAYRDRIRVQIVAR